MRILLVRNAEHALYGLKCWPKDDTALSPAGVEQSRLMCSELERMPITVIYTSPTIRARETVRPAVERLRKIVYQESPAFKALDMGECTGMTHDETKSAIGDAAWEEVFSNPRPDVRYFKDGETLNQLTTRAWGEFQRIIGRGNNENDVVVISTHEEVIGALLCKMVDLPLSNVWWWGGRLRPPLYASITEVMHKNGKWTLVRFGCTKHLESS